MGDYFQKMNILFNFTLPLTGGILIGLAVTIMLLLSGRVTGISGILYGFINRYKNDWSWRGYFLLGLILGGVTLKLTLPGLLDNDLNHSPYRVALAGLLVGYGTLLGNGCTSGHGVCGISRFSLRSIVATLTFMASGVLTVLLMRWGGF